MTKFKNENDLLSKQMKVKRYRGLAHAILQRAEKDAVVGSWQNQILTFADSDWCRDLCDLAEVCYDKYVKAIRNRIKGIEVPKQKRRSSMGFVWEYYKEDE